MSKYYQGYQPSRFGGSGSQDALSNFMQKMREQQAQEQQRQEQQQSDMNGAGKMARYGYNAFAPTSAGGAASAAEVTAPTAFAQGASTTGTSSMFGPASFAQGASTTGAAPIGGSSMFAGGAGGGIAGGGAGGAGMAAFAVPAALVAALGAKLEYGRKANDMSYEKQLMNPGLSMQRDIGHLKIGDRLGGGNFGSMIDTNMKGSTDLLSGDFSGAWKNFKKSGSSLDGTRRDITKGIGGAGKSVSNFLSKLF